MMTSTNLAQRPFRNERLPWLLAGLLMVGALVLSFVHGRFINRLFSGDEARTVRLVREDETRIARLEEGLAEEPPLKIDPAELTRLRAFKELVDLRVFPWGLLLSELEGTLQDDVRLTRISPTTARGVRGMMIDLAGVAKSKDAVFSLAEALDRAPAFSNASLKSLLEQNDGIEFAMEVVFDPDPLPSPDPSPAGRSAAAGNPPSVPAPVSSKSPLSEAAKTR